MSIQAPSSVLSTCSSVLGGMRCPRSRQSKVPGTLLPYLQRSHHAQILMAGKKQERCGADKLELSASCGDEADSHCCARRHLLLDRKPGLRRFKNEVVGNKPGNTFQSQFTRDVLPDNQPVGRKGVTIDRHFHALNAIR